MGLHAVIFSCFKSAKRLSLPVLILGQHTRSMYLIPAVTSLRHGHIPL